RRWTTAGLHSTAHPAACVEVMHRGIHWGSRVEPITGYIEAVDAFSTSSRQSIESSIEVDVAT
ncbi:hypothetical protein, partial [Paralcaligenes ginsengisoli]